MNKIETLKELNKTISNMCVDLETKIFVEDMDVEDDMIIKDYKAEDADTKTIM